MVSAKNSQQSVVLNAAACEFVPRHAPPPAAWHGAKLEHGARVTRAKDFQRLVLALRDAVCAGDLRRTRSILDDAKRSSVEELVSLVNSRHGELLQLPAHVAATHGHTHVLKLLVEHGANINARDSHLDTPLHLAIAHNKVACTRWLVSSGADHHALNADGRAPLHMASQENAMAVACARLLSNTGRRKFDRAQLLAFKRA